MILVNIDDIESLVKRIKKKNLASSINKDIYYIYILSMILKKFIVYTLLKPSVSLRFSNLIFFKTVFAGILRSCIWRLWYWDACVCMWIPRYNKSNEMKWGRVKYRRNTVTKYLVKESNDKFGSVKWNSKIK